MGCRFHDPLKKAGEFLKLVGNFGILGGCTLRYLFGDRPGGQVVKGGGLVVPLCGTTRRVLPHAPKAVEIGTVQIKNSNLIAHLNPQSYPQPEIVD